MLGIIRRYPQTRNRKRYMKLLDHTARTIPFSHDWKFQESTDRQDEEGNSRLLSRHQLESLSQALKFNALQCGSTSPPRHLSLQEDTAGLAQPLMIFSGSSSIKGEVAKQAVIFGPCLSELGLRGSELMTRIYKDRVNCPHITEREDIQII